MMDDGLTNMKNLPQHEISDEDVTSDRRTKILDKISKLKYVVPWPIHDDKRTYLDILLRHTYTIHSLPEVITKH